MHCNGVADFTAGERSRAKPPDKMGEPQARRWGFSGFKQVFSDTLLALGPACTDLLRTSALSRAVFWSSGLAASTADTCTSGQYTEDGAPGESCRVAAARLARFVERGFAVRCILLLGILLNVTQLLRADESKSLPAIRIVTVGDSTVSSYPKPPAEQPDLTGWGQIFGEFFSDRVNVLNHAASGRSSKSFIREGRWEKALAEKPDYVFIQFGHNDCPGKGDRTTDPNGDYRDYLRQYIDEARAAGARPILVTPVSRRTFREGKIQDILRPYAEAMIAVGQEKQVAVIDLNAASMELFNQLGDEGSADLSASATDRTHFSRKGALTMARLIVDRLPAAEPNLQPYLKTPAQ